MAALYAALDAARRERKLTWRQLAAQAQVSPSTLSRLAVGKRPDVDGLAALCDWAGRSADNFIVRRNGVPVPDVLGAMLTHLRYDPALTPSQAESLSAIITASYRVFTGRKGR